MRYLQISTEDTVMSIMPQQSESISLEYEIEEARRRAEEFSRSLQNTRKEVKNADCIFIPNDF